MEERLQKILSSAGAASRRKAEEYILSGRVRVNGAVASLGDKADPERDTVTLDGKVLHYAQEPVYILLHKPTGYVSTLSDEKGRKTVADLVSGCGRRVWPVGRLDLNSEGLLLMTDDGELTQRLLHPRYEVEKEYLVWVTGDRERAIPLLSAPMELDGGERVEGADVHMTCDERGEEILSVTIHQGKNRQVRRMCDAAGLHVRRLVRIREGRLLLGDLPKGAWRYLTEEEIEALKN